MADQWEIKGKNFLVTGGASGIGAANVRALLEEGAKNVAIFDVNVKAGQSMAEQYNQSYPDKVMYVKCDVANDDSLTLAFNQVLAKLERIDAIINNAGIFDDTLDRWASSVDVNLKGVISLTWKGVGHMRKDAGGSGGAIINVSSTAAFFKLPGIPVYAATKSGVLQFGRTISCENFYETTGVRVMTICYGATETSMLQNEMPVCDELCASRLHEITQLMAVQKAQTAGKSIISMLRLGANGSIWLSQNNDPVRDVTSIIEGSYEYTIKALNLLL